MKTGRLFGCVLALAVATALLAPWAHGDDKAINAVVVKDATFVMECRVSAFAKEAFARRVVDQVFRGAKSMLEAYAPEMNIPLEDDSFGDANEAFGLDSGRNVELIRLTANVESLDLEANKVDMCGVIVLSRPAVAENAFKVLQAAEMKREGKSTLKLESIAGFPTLSSTGNAAAASESSLSFVDGGRCLLITYGNSKSVLERYTNGPYYPLSPELQELLALNDAKGDFKAALCMPSILRRMCDTEMRKEDTAQNPMLPGMLSSVIKIKGFLLALDAEPDSMSVRLSMLMPMVEDALQLRSQTVDTFILPTIRMLASNGGSRSGGFGDSLASSLNGTCVTISGMVTLKDFPPTPEAPVPAQ